MSARIALWVSLVTLTTLMPGFAIGLLAESRRWSAKRCRRTAFLLALFFWGVAGCVAQYPMHTIPFGWVAQAPWARWVTQGIWLSAAWAAPMVAQRIASPATKLKDMPYW
jgi:hypothetical protein